MTVVRRGIRLGIDVGRARIGVARSDPDALLAFPVETVPRNADSVARILALVVEYDATDILVGLPTSLGGGDTASTTDARTFASELAAASDRSVRLVDERLSTVTAHAVLRETGRSERRSRSMVDQVAAVVLLQQALDVERQSGNPAGSAVASGREPA